MVWFQCEDCGENLKKPKLAGHFRSCSAYKVTGRSFLLPSPSSSISWSGFARQSSLGEQSGLRLIDFGFVLRRQLSCIDCGEFFSQGTVQAHNQCISEAEKYGPKGQNKQSNNAQGKQDKPKPNADVDTNVGLSTYPPWFCSLCNTTTTSKQTLLSHADGKKHRAEAKAYHASQKQANGPEQTLKETVGTPTDNERGVVKDAAKRKRTDDTVSEEPDNIKKQNNLSKHTGEVIQSANGEPEHKAKSKSTADELASSANLKDNKQQKIKWKKIITKALQTVRLLYRKCCCHGAMKLKRLQKLVIKELLECGLTEDKEQMHALLMDKIASSSRFSVDGKHIRLVA
ncbi:hypothetical protein ABZP36_017545 [Zizania latifolia]